MRILLAEDERDLASAVKRVLEYAKYDVDVVYDGLGALDYLAYQEYDAAIFDIMMPRLDGLSLVKRIREKGSSLPIIMLTARAETDDKVLGLDAGADDYLTKPFEVKELLARIRALLRRKGEVMEPYSFGNATLDPNTFELSAVKSVRLSNKEYRLMEILMRNKNAFLSTERLMESVWDIDSEAEINVVWAFLSALRKKLSLIGASFSIKAARGVGYRLEEKK
ncbi:MAG: response regulator transcription factor [Bacilli bacterium]|nr:response regulator transcription factor [Bacilli bacterium]